ncbi:hypothetical protein C0J45_3394, partial [Silurus meridionalis]
LGSNWECLSDYLYTITCELNLTSEPHHHDALYWLEFYDESNNFECVLTSHTYTWVCVLNLSTRVQHTFMDVDMFRISLKYSHHDNSTSKVLWEDYRPINNIQPVPPSNLTLLWKPDEAVFQWLSGYSANIMLVPFLKYQLRIQQKDKVVDVDSVVSTSVSVPTSTFTPNAKYTAKVRSVPQEPYHGVWSHWGPAVYWTTGPSDKTPDMDFRILLLALLVLPVIWFCHFSYTRLKKCTLHPSPVPHIGDFKCSAVLPEKVGELLHREESLQIDSLTEDPTSTQHQTSHAEESSGHTSSTGSPSTLQTSGGSKVSLSSWMQMLISAEKGSVTYSNDYCTLSHTMSEHA